MHDVMLHLPVLTNINTTLDNVRATDPEYQWVKGGDWDILPGSRTYDPGSGPRYVAHILTDATQAEFDQIVIDNGYDWFTLGYQGEMLPPVGEDPPERQVDKAIVFAEIEEYLDDIPILDGNGDVIGTERPTSLPQLSKIMGRSLWVGS